MVWASLVAQTVGSPPAMQETWVRSLGWEDPLEEGMATHSSILAWRIPWTEESSGLQLMGSQRVGHDWTTKHSTAHRNLNILKYVTCFLFHSSRPCVHNMPIFEPFTMTRGMSIFIGQPGPLDHSWVESRVVSPFTVVSGPHDQGRMQGANNVYLLYPSLYCIFSVEKCNCYD